MTFKRLLASTWLLLLSVLSTHISYAQDKTITGKITDSKDGSPIVGASVVPKGTTKGTSTGSDGTFRLIVASNVTTLVITSVGFERQEVSASGGTVDVSLVASGANLNEIVVVGYGTARKKDLTGSVQSVKAKDFNKGVIVSPDQAIQGKAAGVMVINNSGQPGGATTVRIRGTASIRSGQQPLYVIDGVQLSGGSARPGATGNGIGATPGTNPLNFINPNDIATIDILKDASATAIYGSRGANGVILITTKRGQSGDPTVEVNSTVGFSNMMKQLEVLDGNEYRAALQKYNITSGGNFGGNFDAMDAITRTGITQNYSLSVRGGNENARYTISAGYLNQNGIIEESQFKKFNAGVTGNFKLLNSRKLGLDFNMIVSGTQEQIAPISNDAGFTGSLVGQALQWNPTHALIKPGTDSAWIDPAVGATTVNPLAMLKAYDDRASENVILASISPYYKITKDLEYKLLYSVTRRTGVNRGELKKFINIDGINGKGIAGIDNVSETQQQLTHTLNYNKKLSSAVNLNAVVGYEFQKNDTRRHGMSGTDFTDAGNLRYYDILQYSTQGNRTVFSYSNPTTELQSYFGRAIVNLLDKYLITATLRADGSSKFGENNRYGYFPSVGAAWNVSSEEFMKDVTFVNNLKFRVGWGQNGNQEFPAGASLRRFAVGQQAINETNFKSPDLKWETSTTTNIGLDFSVADDRVFGSVDYFSKKTTDVLFEQTVAQPGATGKFWVNLPGTIENSGVEVSLNGALVRQKDLTWNLGINASFLKNEVTDFVGFFETGALHGQGISGATSQRLIEGQPLNVYYLPIFEGIDKATGQSVYRGGDPAVNKFYVGSPNPKMLLGLSTDVQYKRFAAYINMNGTFGHYLYNNTANTVLPIGNLGTRNVAKTVINSSVKEDASNPIAPSTRYLEKGNYLKMANATISYSFGKIGNTFRNMTLSLTGQNLFVITKYTGFDPEVNTDKSVNGIPSLGIEYTPYPTARTILFGVNFSL